MSKFILPQGVTNNVRLTFSVGDIAWEVLHIGLNETNKIGDTNYNILL